MDLSTITSDRNQSRDINSELPSLYYEERIFYAENYVPVTVFLTAVFLTGLFGNALTFFLYLTKYSKSNHRVLVLWLSMVDFLSCIQGIPFVLYDLYNTLTFTNVGLCKFGKLFGVFFPSFSLGLLTFIAIVRYYKVCKPFTIGLTTKKSHAFCAAIGILTFLILAVPALKMYGIQMVTRSDKKTGHDCTIIEESQTSVLTKVQRVLTSVFFVAALLVCLVMYSLVGKFLIKRSKVFVYGNPGAGNDLRFGKTNTLSRKGYKTNTLGAKSVKENTLCNRSPKLNTHGAKGLRGYTPSPGDHKASTLGTRKAVYPVDNVSSTKYPNSEGKYERRDEGDSIATNENCSAYCSASEQSNSAQNELWEDAYNSETDDSMSSDENDYVPAVDCECDACGENINRKEIQTSEQVTYRKDNGVAYKDENAEASENKNMEGTEELKDMTTVNDPAEATKPNQELNSVPVPDVKITNCRHSIGLALDTGRVVPVPIYPKRKKGLERSRRLSIIFLVVTAASFSTCVPFLIFSIIEIINPEIAVIMNQHADISAFLNYFYFLNSALNPIVYGFMDAKFRREMKRLFNNIRNCRVSKQFKRYRF